MAPLVASDFLILLLVTVLTNLLTLTPPSLNGGRGVLTCKICHLTPADHHVNSVAQRLTVSSATKIWGNC